MTALDLKRYISSENKISFILEEAGFKNVKEHSNYFTAMNKDGDNPNAVVIYKGDTLLYINYTRNVSAEDKKDIFDAIQYVKECDFGTAIKWIHNKLGLSYSYNGKSKSIVSQKEQALNIFKKYQIYRQTYNTSDIKTLDVHDMSDIVFGMIFIDIFREGITKKAIDKFGLGYDFIHKRTVYVHHHWLTGDIIGLNERTSIKNYDELGITKFYLTKNFHKGINLYGLWENREEIERKGEIVLVEAEKSCLKRYSRNDGTLVALSGKSISSEQVRIILGLRIKEIIIALDKDVDICEVFAIAERFYGLRTVSFILDRDNILGSKDSPADANNNNYLRLYNNRIRYDEKLHKKFLEYITKGDEKLHKKILEYINSK